MKAENIMKMSNIYGHKKIISQLVSAIDNDRIGHAYIFEGEAGTGRKSVALAFSAALVCEEKKSEACGVCRTCKMSAAGTHPDIKIITNEFFGIVKKTDILAADTIREMRKDIYIKPYEGKRKVYIVPGAETMTVQAQNSLLKVLEEPPSYAVIILIAENSGAFLPTVLSRAVEIHFGNISINLVEDYLIKNCDIEKEKINIFAGMSGGVIGKAPQFINDTDFCELRNTLIYHITQLSDSNIKNAYDLSEYIKKQKVNFKKVFGIIESWFRDVMIISCVKNKSSKYKIVNIDKNDELFKFCEVITMEMSVNIIEIFRKYETYINQNVNYATAIRSMVVEWWEEIHDRSNRSKI